MAEQPDAQRPDTQRPDTQRPDTQRPDTQRRYKEFLDLMPLTLALAGLPDSEIGRYFTAEQIESRVFTIKHAYKSARQVAKEAIAGS